MMVYLSDQTLTATINARAKRPSAAAAATPPLAPTNGSWDARSSSATYSKTTRTGSAGCPLWITPLLRMQLRSSTHPWWHGKPGQSAPRKFPRRLPVSRRVRKPETERGGPWHTFSVTKHVSQSVERVRCAVLSRLRDGSMSTDDMVRAEIVCLTTTRTTSRIFSMTNAVWTHTTRNGLRLTNEGNASFFLLLLSISFEPIYVHAFFNLFLNNHPKPKPLFVLL
mmetsp:Transcript_108067/g.220654  ORF Transcript_108067/g.220654 Transcript_108067/m.220654 type:complete len:224 (-) Transcript_108067:172-843(-)